MDGDSCPALWYTEMSVSLWISQKYPVLFFIEWVMRQFVWVAVYIPVHVCIYDIQVMT